jgi:hypothetical protein
MSTCQEEGLGSKQILRECYTIINREFSLIRIELEDFMLTNTQSPCRRPAIGRGLLIALLALLGSALVWTALSAHEEPYKSRWEKMAGEQARKRMTQAGVLAITAWKHEVDGGMVKDRKSRSIRQEYDSQGRLISISAFVNDAISESAVYSYNPMGDMISDIDLSAGGIVTESNIFIYDEAGRVIAGYGHDVKGKAIGRFIHRFDRTNRRIVYVKFDEHDAVDYTIEYQYAGDFDGGDYVRATKKSKGNITVLQADKVLDPSGRTIEKKVSQIDQNKTYSFRYRYDRQGIISEIIRIGADGGVETATRFSIDARGLYTESRVTDGQGVLKSLTTYEYERMKPAI